MYKRKKVLLLPPLMFHGALARTRVHFPHLLRRSAAPPAAGAQMVTLVVATSADVASENPAKALLAMPGWNPGPSIHDGIASSAIGDVRLLIHNKFITVEDDLDLRWEEASGEVVSEVVFLSRHAASSGVPALTVHPIGIPHVKDGEATPSGGKPAWAGPPNPRIGAWLRRLKEIAEAQGLIPEFEITLEATHHGPVVNTPTMFVEIGSTEKHWGRKDAAEVVALLVWEGLGLDGGGGLGNWPSNNGRNKILFGIGGGHYVRHHMDVAWKNGVWVGHLLSKYSLPMEDTNQKKGESHDGGVGGTWKQAIRVSYEATKSAFPGGEVLAYIDLKSFKAWQKNAILSFLAEQNIKVGKSADFV